MYGLQRILAHKNQLSCKVQTLIGSTQSQLLWQQLCLNMLLAAGNVISSILFTTVCTPHYSNTALLAKFRHTLPLPCTFNWCATKLTPCLSIIIGRSPPTHTHNDWPSDIPPEAGSEFPPLPLASLHVITKSVPRAPGPAPQLDCPILSQQWATPLWWLEGGVRHSNQSGLSAMVRAEDGGSPLIC